MDPFIRDQLQLMKSQLVKNISLVGKYKIRDLMNHERFESIARKLAELEAKEVHFMGCFEAADQEENVTAFEEKFQSLISVPHETNINQNPVVQRCREYCREQFQEVDENEMSMNESQEIAITETNIATTDPFTKSRLRDPVVNRICKHIYERSTIQQIISRNSRTKCPVVGCGNREYITDGHLIDDPYIRAQLQDLPESQDDADETIEDTEQINLNDTEMF